MNRLKVACLCSIVQKTDRQAGERMMRSMEGHVAMPSKGGIHPTHRKVRNPGFALCIIYFKQSKEYLSSLSTDRGNGNEPDLRSNRHSGLTHPSRTGTLFCFSRLRSVRFKVKSVCGTQKFCTLYWITLTSDL